MFLLLPAKDPTTQIIVQTKILQLLSKPYGLYHQNKPQIQ